MKYNRLLFIFIPVGILLSGCAMSRKSSMAPSSSSQASAGNKAAVVVTTKSHSVPLPAYVKHNESLEYPTPTTALSTSNASNPTPTTALSTSNASIAVKLGTSDSKNQAYIEYRITDKYGWIRHTGRWHHWNATTLENMKSDLFITPFLLDNDLSLTTLPSGEVQITGHDAKGTPHTWMSSQNRFGDDDVTWITLP
jgi:glucan-binding YG repeat protein